jgi:bacillopeptidase F
MQVTDSANSTVNQSYSFTISVQAHSVLLDWTASPSETAAGYNVYRSITNGSGYAKINTSPIGGTAYTDTTVVDGQIYYYVVTALDATGDESAYSEVVQMNIL